MPVALALPAIAGAVGGYVAVGYGAGFLGAMVVGAVVGAAVGGIQAAVTKGNIGEGILFGAVGGAVGGAIGGWAAGAGPGFWAGSTTTTTAPTQTVLPGGIPSSSSALSSAPATKTGGLLGLGSTSEALLVGGAMSAAGALMTPDQEIPYGQTQAGFEAELALKDKIAQLQADSASSGSSGAVAAARLAAEQRQREAELNAQLTREQMAQSGSEFHKSLAQRKAELERPIEEANLARKRRIATAEGLSLANKRKAPGLFEEDLAVTV